ncbi:MAG: hypothetical protein V4568_18805 [Pseudomonadota bacterium]
MLADSSGNSFISGTLGKHVHLKATSLYELLDFIANELPRWRERPERPKETAEAALTAQLCAHLTSAARLSSGWDNLLFRTEIPDEQCKGRKIDLAPSPCAATFWVDGRRSIDFDTLLPIECKRLPTPKDKVRDEWEYVINRNASTGGIQRFKAGYHGGAHNLGAMIAYVQEEGATTWYSRVTAWIKELVDSGHAGWTMKDLIRLEMHMEDKGVSIYSSSHARDNELPNIELRHLWVVME